ncbi:MAG TPA: CopD family protein [Sporichthyaceae bacterium]|nr:CopD family protein [Sporichthyaceae bacterium]
MRRHCARLAGILVLGAAAVLLPAARASAHAELDSTSPRAGQVLAHEPASIDLHFSDAVDLSTATVRVFAPDGTQADLARPVFADPTHDVVRVVLPAGEPAGTRTVVYRVVATDGHPTQGQFSYSVGLQTAAAVPDGDVGGGTGIGLGYGIARWAAFVGLAMAMGTTVVSAVGRPGPAATGQLRRLFTTGWVTLVLATAAGLVLYGPYVLGRGVGGLLDPTVLRTGLHTKVGRLLLIRLAVLSALGVVVSVAGRRARGRPPVPTTAGPAWGRLFTALGAGGLLCLTWSLATHADHGGNRLIALPMDLLHLWAMSVWLGGLPALVVLVRSKDRAALGRTVPVFSRIAATCVGLLVLTGVAEAWRQVGSPSALTTPYGKVLLTKLTVVVALVGLGALARRSVPGLLAQRAAGRPGRRYDQERATHEQHFGRVVTIETVLGGLVLAITAVLVGMQPASAAHRSAEQERLVAAHTDGVVVAKSEEHTVGFRLDPVKPGTKETVWHSPDRPAGPTNATGWVTSEVSPAAPGLPNELHLTVLDALGRPITLSGATVELRLPDGGGLAHEFRLRPSAPGHLVVPFTLPGPGSFAVRVVLLAGHGERTVVLIPLTGM